MSLLSRLAHPGPRFRGTFALESLIVLSPLNGVRCLSSRTLCRSFFLVFYAIFHPATGRSWQTVENPRLSCIVIHDAVSRFCADYRSAFRRSRTLSLNRPASSNEIQTELKRNPAKCQRSMRSRRPAFWKLEKKKVWERLVCRLPFSFAHSFTL